MNFPPPPVVVVVVSMAVIFVLLYVLAEESSAWGGAGGLGSARRVSGFYVGSERAPPLESLGDESTSSSTEMPLPVILAPEVQKLVDALKEATRVAASASAAADGDVSEAAAFDDSTDTEDWHAKNPCRSRAELLPLYARRKHVRDAGANPQWAQVLREYSKLHRTCLRKAGNLTAYFQSRRSHPGCKFVVADVMGGAGLGNKVLVVASTFLYAVLTLRVVLVPVDTLLPSVMCEPLEGSSWRVDNSSVPFPPMNHPGAWQLAPAFYQELDRQVKRSVAAQLPYASAVTFASGKMRDQWHPRDRFFCSAEQAQYLDVHWLYVTGCLYSMPNLFAIASFRPTLEALFPDRMALTHLLRSVMLPADTVWDRSVRIDDAYLRHADRRVGIQVRYKDGAPHYRKMNEVFNERITSCALANRILPEVDFAVDERADDSHVAEPAPPRRNVVMVFIACLYTGLHDHLTRLFLRHPSATGESVGLVQVTHEDRQDFGLEVDRQALAEVMSLSFSDDLFVTPISTYGGLAQAYGALRPWFIEIRPRSDKSCTRGVSVDICYQGGLERYYCPHDPSISGKNISDVVPYLRRCLDEDYAKGGVQLITDLPAG